MHGFYQSYLFTNECTSDCLKKSIQIYIKIAPKCSSVVAASSGSSLSVLLKLHLVKVWWWGGGGGGGGYMEQIPLVMCMSVRSFEVEVSLQQNYAWMQWHIFFVINIDKKLGCDWLIFLSTLNFSSHFLKNIFPPPHDVHTKWQCTEASFLSLRTRMICEIWVSHCEDDNFRLM